MADIILAALNAKYIHAAFGLRYLFANLGELRERARLLEFDINQRPLEIAEQLLSENPSILGLGIYIWNVGPATELVAVLKRVRPEVRVILGGPEVSYETERQEIFKLCDYVVTGEADLKFAEVCRQLLAGAAPCEKIIPSPLPQLAEIALPYDLYSPTDIEHRLIYVEASRGCPFSCDFCLSSLDIPVRQFPLESLLPALQSLLDRGAKHLKFVDRTFNLNTTVSGRILRFLLERYEPGRFFHFEMIPDHLPESLREIIARFPAGALQFEVGIQTFNEEVAARISRRQNYATLEENFGFLRARTGVHLHADLIFGLPGEDLESFASGFDRLVDLGPNELQVGILKRLRGTPIVRHDSTWGMVYSPHPPYEILRNNSLDFATVQKLRRFARYWDLVSNSGNFLETAPLIWRKARSAGDTQGECERNGELSPFWQFLRFAEWLYGKIRRTDSIALTRLAELIFQFLTEEVRHAPEFVAASLARDYRRSGRQDVPALLRTYLPPDLLTARRATARTSLPKRQARHLQ